MCARRVTLVNAFAGKLAAALLLSDHVHVEKFLKFLLLSCVS